MFSPIIIIGIFAFQAFGVCCSQADQARPGSPTPTAGPPRVEKPDPGNPVPPNWPPPIPTHPPDHTIPPLPTHPPFPGYPTVPTQPTRPPTRPTTVFTTRPTPSTPQWPPPLPTHPPAITRPPTRPTTSSVPPWATPPTTARPTLAPAQPDNEIVDNSCGAKNGYQDQERIVGGQSADVGEWPWIVSTKSAIFSRGRKNLACLKI